MAVKKMDLQEEMVNEMIQQIIRVSGEEMTPILAGEIVAEVIKATEKKTEPSKILNMIGRLANFPKDDLRTEEVFAIISLSPLTQTHFPFNDPKLEALKASLGE